MEIKQHPLLTEFCDCNPNFINDLDALPAPYKNQFIQKFNKEKNRSEFLSKISELKFVQFFIEKGFDFDYEPKVFDKRPDLKIRMGEKEIIGDIKRFNLSEEDQVKQRFFYELSTALKKIELPYIIGVHQLKDFLFENQDITEIKNKFHEWLLTGEIIPGLIFDYQNLFNIKIISVTGKNKHLIFSYHTIENKIHAAKLFSIVKQKIDHYKESIINKDYPFFICIDLLFDSMIEPEDFIMKFRGIGVYDIDSHSESSDLGEFYKTEDYKNVLGILVRYNNEFTWIRNFREADLFGNRL